MSILGGTGTSQGGTAGRKVRLLTVLDVGSSKVSCVIARLRPHEGGALLPGRTHRMRLNSRSVLRSTPQSAWLA